jgi:hypothetical protein
LDINNWNQLVAAGFSLRIMSRNLKVAATSFFITAKHWQKGIGGDAEVCSLVLLINM